jgi:ABC-type sugar transport system permease subunit
MVTSEAPSAKVKPSAWWYALPVALLVVAFLLVALAVSRFVTFFTADRVAYQPGQEITVDSDGFSVYTRSRSVTVECSAVGQGRRVHLDGESGITVSQNQDHWYVVASSPGDMPPGRYQLSCGSPFGGAVNVYIGPRVSFSALVKGLVLGLAVPVLMVIAAFVAFLVIAIRRGRSKRPPLRPPAPGAPGWAQPGAPGWAQPGAPGWAQPGPPSYPPPPPGAPPYPPPPPPAQPNTGRQP